MTRQSLTRCSGRRITAAALSLSWLAGLVALGAVPAAAKEPIKAPGSRIAIALPDGFEISKLFSGFLHPNARASIIIAELPTSRYAEIIAGMTDEALAAKGISNIERGNLERPDEHHFFTGRQNARGEEITKFILLLRNTDTVAVITANVPKMAVTDGDLTHDEIRKALASATLTDTAAPIVKPFTVPDTSAFKEAGKIMGSAILYTLDGVLAPKEKGTTRSVLIIGPSIDRIDISDIDLKRFSQQALDNLGGYENLATEAGADVTVGGMKGVRQKATAVAASTKTPVKLDQVLLVRPGGGYFRLLAVLRQDEASRLAADVDRVFKGFEAVSNPKAQ